MSSSPGVNLQVSENAVKWIVGGACFLGACWLIHKLFLEEDEKDIPLPSEAKTFSQLPELSPSVFEDVGFHPVVKQRAEKLFMAGEYVAAVRAASVALFDVMRSRSGLAEDATQLVKLAFRGEPKRGIAPRLEFKDLAPEHVTNMGDGLIQMLEGFAKSVRKVHMHAEIEISKSQALQEITVACYLATSVEENTVLMIEAEVET